MGRGCHFEDNSHHQKGPRAEKVSRERKVKENPREANPNKRRRGPKAKDLKVYKANKAKAMEKQADIEMKMKNVIDLAMSSPGSASRQPMEINVEKGAADLPTQREQRQRSWTPGTQKVPKYMNQGVTAGEDNWV